jgi:hypothetical protein
MDNIMGYISPPNHIELQAAGKEERGGGMNIGEVRGIFLGSITK